MMETIARVFRYFGRDESGAVTMEFVISLPLIIGALIFVFELGWAIFAYQTLTSDVAAAVRYVSRVPLAQCQSLTGNDITIAKNIAQCGQLPTAGATPSTCTNLKFPWNSSSSPTLSVGNAFYSAGSSNTFNTDFYVAEVQAKVPMTLALLRYLGVNSGITLVVADEARCMGN